MDAIGTQSPHISQGFDKGRARDEGLMFGFACNETPQLMTSYSLHSGKQRIIAYLLRELPESEHDGINVAVTLPTNKGVIASRLNLTPEYLSRILHDLEHQGLIAISGRAVTVPDLEKLRSYNAR